MVARVPHLSCARPLRRRYASALDECIDDGLLRCDRPESTRYNHRAGRNEKLFRAIECRFGEFVMGCGGHPNRHGGTLWLGHGIDNALPQKINLSEECPAFDECNVTLNHQRVLFSFGEQGHAL